MNQEIIEEYLEEESFREEFQWEQKSDERDAIPATAADVSVSEGKK